MTSWKYCECGCHGHEYGKYWAFMDVRGDGMAHLHSGHGWMSPKLGIYHSLDECVKAIRVIEGLDEVDFEIESVAYDFAIPVEAMERIHKIINRLKEKAIAP